MGNAVGLPPVTEKEYMQQIVQLACLYHWRVYHTFFSIRSEPGFPDLICVRGHRCLALEVKTDRGRLTRSQREWIDALADVPGIEAHVIRPADFDFVQQLLR